MSRLPKKLSTKTGEAQNLDLNKLSGINFADINKAVVDLRKIISDNNL